MTPVMQTQFGNGRGNCLLACVASVLGRPLEEIPDFNMSGCGWFADLYEWCINEGYGLFHAKPPFDGLLVFNHPVILMFSVEGADPEAELHAVVGLPVKDEDNCKELSDGNTQYAWKVDIIHDPNPTQPKRLELMGMLVILPAW